MAKKKVYVESVGSTGLILLICFAGIGLAFYSTFAVIIMLFGLLPGLIAIIVDQEPKKFISNIVLSFNVAGVSPFLIKIIKSGAPAYVATEIMIEPQTWLMIYFSAAVGWVIYWIFPHLAFTLYNVYIQFRIVQLNTELDKLAEEWGEDTKYKQER